MKKCRIKLAWHSDSPFSTTSTDQSGYSKWTGGGYKLISLSDWLRADGSI